MLYVLGKWPISQAGDGAEVCGGVSIAFLRLEHSPEDTDTVAYGGTVKRDDAKKKESFWASAGDASC